MSISDAVAGIIIILAAALGLFMVVNNMDFSGENNTRAAISYPKECKPMEINILGVTIRKNDTEVCK